jgi:hypothetical protein
MYGCFVLAMIVNGDLTGCERGQSIEEYHQLSSLVQEHNSDCCEETGDVSLKWSMPQSAGIISDRKKQEKR